MFSSFTNNSVRKKFKLSLSIALVFTLILCGIGLFSSVNSSSNSSPTISTQDPIVKPDDKVEEEIPSDEFEDVNNNTDVVVAEEKLVAPFSVDATIVRHFFDVDDLSNEDISYIAENYFSGNISPLYPITFIVKNSELIDSHSGIMYNDSLETFLRNSGVIYGK